MTFDIMRGEMIISPLIIIVDRGEMAISPLMIFLSIDFDINCQINYIFLPRLFISGLLGNDFLFFDHGFLQNMYLQICILLER